MKPGTPLPWLLAGSILVTDQFDEYGDTESRGEFDDTADAEYAVHAANLYPELLEALRNCKDLLIAMDNTLPEWEPNVIAARALLARCDGAQNEVK